MKFKVTDLEMLTRMVHSANSDDEIRLSKSLKEKQPGFYTLIEDVKIDSRCLYSSRFCSLFCSLALDMAESIIGYDLSPFSGSELIGIAGMIVRKNDQIGKRACTYPDRVQKHVLDRNYFDNEDSAWLRMMISALLVTLEGHS